MITINRTRLSITVKPLKPATHGEWQTGRFTEGGRFKNQ